MSRFDRLFYSAAAICMVAGLALMSCVFSDALWLPAAALAPSEAMADESRAEIPPPEAVRRTDIELAVPRAAAAIASEERPTPPGVAFTDPLLLTVSLPAPVAPPAPSTGKAGEPPSAPRQSAEPPPVQKATAPSFRPRRVGRSVVRATSVALLPSSGHGSAAKDAGVRAFSARTAKDPLRALFGFAHRLLEPGKPARVATAETAAEPR